MTGNWLLVLLVIFLLALSAFFVAAEFALISARRTVIEPLAVTSSQARATLRAMEDVSVMMASAQLGITVCGVLLGAVGEPAVAHLLEPIFDAFGVPEGALPPVALALALLLVVGAHVALGEMVPKNIALAGPETTAMRLVPTLMAVTRMLGPVVRGLNRLANLVVRFTGRQPKDEVTSAFTRDEVAGLVAESRAEGLLGGHEHRLITSALEFDTARIDTVLLRDSAVVAMPTGASAAEVERACARTGFSRFPVRGPDGDYLGYLHIRDVLGIPAPDRDLPVPADRIRPLPVVLSGSGLRTALDRMRRQGAHLAQVHTAPVARPTADPVNPNPTLSATAAAEADGEPAAPGDPAPGGMVLGLVALEDVIEQLIGEVRDATRRRPPR